MQSNRNTVAGLKAGGCGAGEVVATPPSPGMSSVAASSIKQAVRHV